MKISCKSLTAAFLALTLAVFTCQPSLAGASAPEANTLPTGGVVTSGQASISQSGKQMTVQQTSDRMSATWSTFNIGSNALVAFQQPGASSVALNYIQDASPSQIWQFIRQRTGFSAQPQRHNLWAFGPGQCGRAGRVFSRYSPTGVSPGNGLLAPAAARVVF